jgi:hypothetical protein
MKEITVQPFTTERAWTVEDVPVLTASVSLPQPVPAADRTARRIQWYYQTQCRAYLRYCEKWLLPQAKTEYRAALAASAPLPCFRAELAYHITYQQNGLLSLYTQSREITLPGRTLVTRRGDTWDFGLGYPVPLSAFFPPHAPWRRQLLALAAEDIQRQECAGLARYNEHWPHALRRTFNSQNYYLTEEGLTFFYPMYAVAPAAEGVPTFTLPYGQGGLSDPPRHRAGSCPGEKP